MTLYTVRDGKVVQATPVEEMTAIALFPGEFSKHLEHRFGLVKRFAPIDAWTIIDDKPHASASSKSVGQAASGCRPRPTP